MKNFKIITAALIALVFAGRAWAGVDLGLAKEDAGQAGAFLDFAASARSLGMGQAHVAVTDDAGSVYWNPAGLGQIQRKDIVSSYASLYENTAFGFFGYAQPTVDMGTFALGMVSLQSGDFEKRSRLGEKQGSFSQSESALLLSYGFKPSDRLSAGLTLKGIRQEIDIYSDTAYGFDMGLQYDIFRSLRLGMAIHNLVAPRIQLKKEEEKYPLNIRGGLSYTGLRNVVLAVDMNQTADRSLKPHFGAEWNAAPLLALRAGIDETQLTAGLGFNVGNWGLDYAFSASAAASDAENLGQSHRFGFHVKFGKAVAEQEVSMRWIRKGQAYLTELRQWMDAGENIDKVQVTKLTSAARQVIRHQGYIKPKDLYTAQGYVSYFDGEFERSVQALGEAYLLDPHDFVLSDHLERARAQMTEDRTRQIVVLELKRLHDLYDRGDWRGAVKSCEKILTFDPANIDAKTYLTDARAKVNEPIEREMKIAKMKFERGEYLDAINSFSRVKELDPENLEAGQMIRRAVAELENESEKQATHRLGQERAVYSLERNPEKGREFYSKGIVLYSQGKVADAAEMWHQALRADDGNTLAKNAYHRARIELQGQP